MPPLDSRQLGFGTDGVRGVAGIELTADEVRPAVEAYKFQASRQSEIERAAADKEKTGEFIGAYAINPVNGARVPVYVADYVLMSYGGGAIMAVPAHDERDYDFAARHSIPAPVVIAPPGWDGRPLA